MNLLGSVGLLRGSFGEICLALLNNHVRHLLPLGLAALVRPELLLAPFEGTLVLVHSEQLKGSLLVRREACYLPDDGPDKGHPLVLAEALGLVTLAQPEGPVSPRCGGFDVTRHVG